MEKERRALQAYAVSLVLMILIIALGFMGLKLKDTQERLIELESGTSERMDMQQEQLNNLQTDYDSLASSTDALAQHVENLGKDLQETKRIQSNTNKALTRLRKQKEELEKRFEEEIELRKQRLSEMRANRSEPSGNWAGVGGVLLTAYEWTGKPCANGNWPTPGYTVASNDYPLGTRIYIEGLGEFVVEDTGGMGSGVIDIYMGDVETCIQFGVQSGNVYVLD